MCADDDDLEKYDANEGWQVLQLEDKVHRTAVIARCASVSVWC